MNIEKIIDYIIKELKNRNKTKIYICGNGGSGKTTLSNEIKSRLESAIVNVISTDDFMADSNLRKNSFIEYKVGDKEYKGRYTSSVEGSYDLKNIEQIIYNLDNNLDCFYFPKKYKEKNNIRKLYSNYDLTIIEGVATAFLDKKDSLSIYLYCSNEVESLRRIDRSNKFDNKYLFDDVRSDQYKYFVEPHKNEFDLIIKTDENYNYEIV